MKKISVITVNYNNKKGLIKTINSVIQQNYTNIEYIIIDGGSSDGSLNIIKESSKIAYWISEKDKGIYDAMNKGIKKSTGDYILFLNSGDYFCNTNVLSSIFKNKNYNEDIIIGRQLYINNNKKSISPKLHYSEVNITFFLSSTLPHQATFIKRNLFDKIGLYDISYKVSADWVFWIRAIVENKCNFTIINKSISYMEEGGVSSDISKCHCDMSIYMDKCLKNGIITWQDIFKVSIQGRMQLFCSRNLFLDRINKLIIWIGKRV